MSHFFFFFYSRRPSPTFSLYFLFSSCVLRLRCYVSSSTSSMLSPPCVNRHTHPQHIIELYCMYCTCAAACWAPASPAVTSSQLDLSGWLWRPFILHPLEGRWHPVWQVTHPCPAPFSGCCLVILNWQSLSQIPPWGGAVGCFNLCFYNYMF